MANADEIRTYLESYPDDHDQRWRFAKKLYEEAAYTSALVELRRLKAVWPDRVPLLRYLGATHYRLGQFSEAASVLEVAVADHPGDVLLLEQLARTYEGAGRRHRAIDIWKLVLKLDGSPRAIGALERLGVGENTPEPGAVPATLQELSTHGGDTIVNCPHCGEANDLFSERCWRCHGDFVVAPRPPDEALREVPPRPLWTKARLWLLVVMVLAAIAVALAGYQWIL